MKPLFLIIFSLFSLSVVSYASSDDDDGEARISSQNAQKKVKDGNPVLSANMIGHMMKAQMYRAQMQYGLAAQEDMKANLLKQQIAKNEESKNKNEDRENTAVEHPDPAQKQALMDPLQAAPTIRQQALPSSSGSAEASAGKPGETLTLDEGSGKASSGQITALGEIKKEDVPSSTSPVPSASTPIPSFLTGELPKGSVSGGLMGSLAVDLRQLEVEFAEATGIESEPVKVETVTPEAQPIPIVSIKADKRDKDKKEKDEFWKSKKKKEAKSKRKGRARGLAKIGKNKKSASLSKAP